NKLTPPPRRHSCPTPNHQPPTSSDNQAASRPVAAAPSRTGSSSAPTRSSRRQQPLSAEVRSTAWAPPCSRDGRHRPCARETDAPERPVSGDIADLGKHSRKSGPHNERCPAREIHDSDADGLLDAQPLELMRQNRHRRPPERPAGG